MPFYWTQKPNLKYKPSMKISDTKNQVILFFNSNTESSLGYRICTRHSILRNISEYVYKVKFLFTYKKNKLEVFKKHFSKTIPLYNQHVCVNLVNQSGSEGLLESFYDQLLKQMNDALVR